jgi:nucleotide-binding universal stress UspA family protein
MQNQPSKLLLASHGTRGARAAERTALRFCKPGGTIHHLIVVPDFWKGMMGDDWLNNAATRDTYGRYVESELAAEVQREVRRLDKEARRRRLRYVPEVAYGKPADCLLERLRHGKFDLAVLGSPRPRTEPGLRSRMLTEEVLRTARIPLLVVPFPHG